jgi:NADP-dependent 3-hydroxy acid dehydrogenase YdfG
LAERLQQDGHNVVGLARDASDTNFPGKLVAVDLTDSSATQAILDALTSEYLSDGVVNNAGLERPQKLGSINLSDLDAVLSLNLHPAILTTQALLPAMRETGYGAHKGAATLPALSGFLHCWTLRRHRRGTCLNFLNSD